MMPRAMPGAVGERAHGVAALDSCEPAALRFEGGEVGVLNEVVEVAERCQRADFHLFGGRQQ